MAKKKASKKAPLSKKEEKEKSKIEKQKAIEKEKKAKQREIEREKKKKEQEKQDAIKAKEKEKQDAIRAKEKKKQDAIRAKEKKKQDEIAAIEEERKRKEQEKIDIQKAIEQAKIDKKKAIKRDRKEKLKAIEKAKIKKEKAKELDRFRKGKSDMPLPELPKGMTVRQYYARTYKEKYVPNKKSVYKAKVNQIKIFLSHPNQHEYVMERVHSFSDYLKKHKSKRYAPWCDKDYLGAPGRDLNQELVHGMIQALEEADLVLVGLPEGPVSNWIIAENRQAKTMRKRILMVNFGNAQIKKGMVRSKYSGFIRIVGRVIRWEERIIEAIEDNIRHGIEYEEF